jgi:cholesterol transport system auxiliary component
MRRRFRRASLGAGAVFLSACFFGQNIPTRYYTLDYVPSPPPERLQRGPYPFVLRLREPTIAEAYRRSQIVYRQSSYQMLFYSYHLWAVDPDRMIGDLLLKHLRAARLFENVTRSIEPYTPDYQLTCDVQAIEEFDGPESWYAHLAIEYQLIDQKTGQVVWKKLYDTRKAVPQKEPVYVIRELSALLEITDNDLIRELEPVLAEAAAGRASGGDSTNR